MDFEWITISDTQQDFPAPVSGTDRRAVDVSVTPSGLWFRSRARGQRADNYDTAADNQLTFAPMSTLEMVHFLAQQSVKTVPLKDVNGNPESVTIGIDSAKLADIKAFLVGD